MGLEKNTLDELRIDRNVPEKKRSYVWVIVLVIAILALAYVRQRWSVLAQYALFDLVHTARLVWAGLLDLAGLAPEGEFDDGGLAAASETVRDTPRLAAAMGELLAGPDHREKLHRLVAELRLRGQDVLARWAGVMVNSGVYAEVVDRHVELYSRLYWWGSLFDERMFAVWIVDYIFAYAFGIVFQYFTIAPMRGLSFRDGIVAAVKADTFSLTAWQIGMYGLMAIGYFLVFRRILGAKLETSMPEFWFMMRIAMLCGFCTSYPVNWWLLRRGIKEPM